MPDHIHLIVAGMDDRADFQRFMATWKQRAGYHFKQRTKEMLWQESYFDHVLRDDEKTRVAIKYVLENPVRKGMVRRFEEYLYSGSDTYSEEHLQGLWRL